MAVHTDEVVNKKVEELKQVCKEKGMRVTDQRIVILKEVAKSCEHPDAETVFDAVRKELPNISLDTVYRTLTSLEELGLIFRVDNQLPKARFDADKTPHHHFLCVKCNEVYDIFLDENEKIDVPKNTLQYGEIKDLNLQIRGICKKCINKAK